MKKGIFMIVSGIIISMALFLTGMFIVTDKQQQLTAISVGVATGLIGGGIAGVILETKRKTDPKFSKKYDISEKNERNIKIKQKAGYITWYISMFVIVTAGLVLVFLDYIIPAYIVLGVLVTHNLSYFAAMFYYSKKI